MNLLMIAIAAAAQPAADFSWLAGYWLSCDGGREVSETWSDPRARVMVGFGMVTSPGTAAIAWEQTRIAPTEDGQNYAFFAQPSGQPGAKFPLVRYGPMEAVFEDPAHDFPQRVIYRREGDILVGRIEGTVNGQEQAAEWRYRAVPLNSRCPASGQ